jgi:hypothetical protein
VDNFQLAVLIGIPLQKQKYVGGGKIAADRGRKQAGSLPISRGGNLAK